MIYGTGAWYHSVATNTPATSGTVMLAALSIILDEQFYCRLFRQIESQPTVALTRLLGHERGNEHGL